jgi:HAD superfamily hydrolase (TIGR01459 family)
LQPTTVTALLQRYDVFFLDAYGVLVQSSGPLPGAAQFLTRLGEAGKTVLLLSNDASRSADTTLKRYQGFGLPITGDQILTSGMLLVDHYAAHGLQGAATIVLGTEDSQRYVRDAGGRVVPADDESAEVVVIGDDDGYPFLDTVNDTITVLLNRLDRGQQTHLVSPNPDLIFPRKSGAYGVTSGAIVPMIEAVLRLRAPGGQLRFHQLGKPYAPMFEAAMKRLPAAHDRTRVVMVGDQILTDIKGARDFGLDAVFVESGIGRRADCAVHGVEPTWVLPSVAD